MSVVQTYRQLPSSASSTTDADSIHKKDGAFASEKPASEIGLVIEEDRGPLRRLFGKTRRDPDSIATQPSVFDDARTLHVYEPSGEYENKHRFDPSARWTWREENKLVRRIDWRIFVPVFFFFFALELDRSNISQANTDNFLPDLGLTTNDYNNGQTIFRASFLFAELPSQLISKWVGPDRWIPTQLMLWSVVGASQFWLSGKTSFFITRSLLGMLQGGFIPDGTYFNPDVILYLSYFYTRSELPVRLAFFWMSNYTADVVSSFLAVGLLQLRGKGGKPGWAWLFLIEGLITFVIGFLAFFLMPAAPTKTKTWYRKQIFSDRQEVIAVNRILRDDPTKSTMHNRQRLTFRALWTAVNDRNLWPLYIIGISFGLPTTPLQSYLTLTLRSIGFSTVTVNLLVIPSTVLACINLFGITAISEFVNNRSFVSMAQNLWTLPLLITRITFTKGTNKWVNYAVSALQNAFPYVHAIQVAWVSRNSNGVGQRTVSASLYNMAVQLSAIIAAQIYRSNDKPLYHRANRILLGVLCFNLALYTFTYFFYRRINAKRDQQWKGMTDDERRDYLENTTDTGSRRLDFRFAY